MIFIVCTKNILSCELSKISAWLKSNQLSLNVDKAKYLFFAKSKPKIGMLINESKIKQTDCITKYLGVRLDDKLHWESHVEHLETKLSAASETLYQLRQCLLHVAHTSPVNGLGRSVWQQQTSLACLRLQSKHAGSVSSYVAFSLAVHTNFIVEF